MAVDSKIKEIRRLQLRAVRGDRASQEALIALNDEIARDVNKRLRELERRGYDYGAYNTPVHFTQTVYDTNRFKKSSQMDGDYYLMRTQSEIGVKFLNMQTSSVFGQKEVEEKRFTSFVDMGIVDPNYSRRKFKNFLKFLSNEESRQVVDSWGTSSTMVEVLFDAYNRKENTKKRMTAVFREYLNPEDSTNLSDLFDKLGLDMRDYRKTKWEDD